MRTDDVTQTTGELLRFPDRVRLGRGHRQLPDRGRRPGGRPRTVHLGHVLAPPRRGGRRRHRRRRRRPLPPLPRGRRAAGRPRRHPLPLLAGLAAAAADRAAARSTGPGWTSTSGWSTSCWPGHPAAGHALPLGPAAGAGGRRRLAGPGHRRAVRRLRRGRARPAEGPDPDLDDPERAVVLGVPRLRGRPPRARAGPSRPPRWPPPTTCCSGTGSPCGRCGRRTAAARWASRSTCTPVDPATGSAEDADAARRVDAVSNRVFLDPIFRGAYPEDLRADVAAVSDLGFVRDGDERTIAAPIDLLGVNYYRRTVVVRPRPGPQPSAAWVGSEQVGEVEQGLPATEMGWEIDPSGLYDVLRRITADYGPVPIYVTENGAAFADAPGAGRRGRRPGPGGLPGPALPGRAAGHRRRASTCAATSSGACWTTSSGRSATRSGSGWSTSTTPPSAGSPSPAPAGTPASPAATACCPPLTERGCTTRLVDETRCTDRRPSTVPVWKGLSGHPLASISTGPQRPGSTTSTSAASTTSPPTGRWVARPSRCGPSCPRSCGPTGASCAGRSSSSSTPGCGQFLDLGSGIPTVGNVHEVAQRLAPDARVVYVDNDPVAVEHSQAILAGDDRTAVVQADLRDPDAVLADPTVRRLLDLSRPIAVLHGRRAALRAGRGRPGRAGRPVPGRGAAGQLPRPLARDGRRAGRPRRPSTAALYQRTATPMTMRHARAGRSGCSTGGSWSSRAWSTCRSGGRSRAPRRIDRPERMPGLAGVGRKP